MELTPLRRVELCLAASLYGMRPEEYDAWRGGEKMAVEDAARNVIAALSRPGEGT